jgi:hypothetical protein
VIGRGCMKDHGDGDGGRGDRSRGPRAFSIKHVRIRCKDVNTRANLLRHLGVGQIPNKDTEAEVTIRIA